MTKQEIMIKEYTAHETCGQQYLIVSEDGEEQRDFLRVADIGKATIFLKSLDKPVRACF